MTSFKVAIAFVVLSAPLPIFSVPARAATAHNSQAGAYGPTTNDALPTHRHLRKKATH